MVKFLKSSKLLVSRGFDQNLTNRKSLQGFFKKFSRIRSGIKLFSRQKSYLELNKILFHLNERIKESTNWSLVDILWGLLEA